MQFPFSINYGMALCINDSITDQKHLALRKSMYIYASERSDRAKKILTFLHTKSAISFNMDGRNNHLQINILRHILRMHKHDFCGEQSIYTRAILAN